MLNVMNLAHMHTEYPWRCWQPCSSNAGCGVVVGSHENKGILSTGLCAILEGIMWAFSPVFSWKPRISTTVTEATNASHWSDGLNPMPFVWKNSICLGLDIFFMKIPMIDWLRDTHNEAYNKQYSSALRYILKAITYLRSLSH